MPLELLFCHGKGLEDKVIRIVTSSPWNHVGFITEEGFLSSDTPDGVKVRPFKDRKDKFEAVGIIDCDDETAKKILDKAWSRLDTRYDYLAIFGDLFQQPWTEKDSFDCSAFVEWSCFMGGYPLLNLPIYKGYKWCNPGQIARSSRVKVGERFYGCLESK